MNDSAPGQNPYAPPKSPVRDISASADGIAPCRDVETACVLFWLSYGVGTLPEIINTFRLAGTNYWGSMVVGFLIALTIGFLVTWWITRKLRAGRNWMRWLVTIVNVASVLVILLWWDFFSAGFRVYTQNATTAVLAGSQMLIGAGALILLHTRASREWFDEWARA